MTDAKHVPWYIRTLPHSITGFFVLMAGYVGYTNAVADVDPVRYHDLAQTVAQHPELAADVTAALEDGVITWSEYRAIDEEGTRRSADDARLRLRESITAADARIAASTTPAGEGAL